ncbi:MAG: aldehyde dehydrogenase family protein [Opitutales bacterium]|nr:aldehyde dehydrogenase family protein [Opitutales bacterium]
MSTRISVLKTYKLYIGGQFPRTESGRATALSGRKGQHIANLCRASRKDLRNAVVAARKAQPNWASKSAYLRGQILYRAAEMLEGRAGQFADELRLQGDSASSARKEVDAAVDLLVHYAGWTDKYTQVFGSINPVASPHFNFSVPEPTGVIGVLPPQAPGLLGLVAAVAPLVAGGNTCVALASPTHPLSAVTFAEVLNDSDLPGGVVNILTGLREEILPPMATYKDIDGIAAYGTTAAEQALIGENAALNVKRVAFHPADALAGDPYRIMEFQEIKTTWHPVAVG